MNAENTQSLNEEVSYKKRELFDAVEIKGLSSKMTRAFSMGRAARFLKFFSRLLTFTSARVYGLMFLSFGVLTLFLHLGEYYFMEDPRVDVSSLVIGAVFSLLSLFLIISDKPICMALRSVKVIDFIVFDFFLINRIQPSGDERKLSGAVGVLIGFSLAILGFFFPTEYAAFVFIALIFVSVAMVSPEFSYIFSLLVFPYLSLIEASSIFFAALIILTLVSFIRKVLMGKRIYSFEIYDLIFILFIFAVLFASVIFDSGNFSKNSLFIIFFALGYIPASNMPVNRRLFDCISGSVVVSSIPVSLYSLIRYLINLLLYERTPSKAFFSSEDTFAAYLTIIAVFSLYLAIKRSRNVKKCYYFSVFLLSILALLTTEHFVVIMALPLLTLAFWAIRSKKVSSHYIFLILAVPVILFLFSADFLEEISHTLLISPTLSERRESILEYLASFWENFFLGSGWNATGKEGDFTYNVYLGLAARFGILAILLFVAVIVLRVIQLAKYKKYFSDSTVNFYVDISTLALVSILIFGSYVDIFADPQMFYCFVSVFAIGSASLRISRKEKEEQLSYYKDLGTSDSADIDVFLKK